MTGIIRKIGGGHTFFHTFFRHIMELRGKPEKHGILNISRMLKIVSAFYKKQIPFKKKECRHTVLNKLFGLCFHIRNQYPYLLNKKHGHPFAKIQSFQNLM